MRTETITWTPIEQSLPDADTTVLIELDPASDYSEPVFLGFYGDGEWHDVHGEVIEVIAWAQLPQGTAGVVVPVASPDLREAAKQFYNRTLADPEVIIRPPNAVKQEAITKAGQCLRIALTAGVREVSKC